MNREFSEENPPTEEETKAAWAEYGRLANPYYNDIMRAKINLERTKRIPNVTWARVQIAMEEVDEAESKLEYFLTLYGPI